MKRLLATWITIALLIYPSFCIASYLIRLKNGKDFFISEYWEEGNQVKFYYYGGVVSIEKDLISTITESDVPYIEVKPVETPEPAPAQTEAKAEEETETTVSKEKEEEGKKLLAELDLLKEHFEMSRHFMTYDELFKFSEDLVDLRNKFVKQGFLNAYRDKVVEILAMGEEVQAMLSKRHQ